jgi:predicted RNA binding protein YcfA (HicA-like mRNA interferase family)
VQFHVVDSLDESEPAKQLAESTEANNSPTSYFMRLTPVSQKDLIKRLRSLGWEGPHYRSNHPFMFKEDSPPLKIPNPHTKDISIDLLSKILKQAGISREEWLESR